MHSIHRHALRVVALLVSGAALAGCGAMHTPDGLPPGTPIAEARQQFVGPSGEYPLPGGGTRLEFRQGRQTYMLDFDPSGRLVSSRPVLTQETFATIIPGMTQDEVLARIGRPAEMMPIGWQKQQLWTYRFGGLEGDCVVFQVSIANDTRTVSDAGTNTDLRCGGRGTRD